MIETILILMMGAFILGIVIGVKLAHPTILR